MLGKGEYSTGLSCFCKASLLAVFLRQAMEVQRRVDGWGGMLPDWSPGLGPQMGGGQGKGGLLSHHHLQQAIYLERLNERGRQEGRD